MISGYDNSDLEAIVPVALVDGNGYRWRQEVVIDTGFNGDLTLPAEFIRELGLPLYGEIPATLADGQTNDYNHYGAIVLWEGERRVIEVMESRNQSLLGTNLIQGSRLTVQMWEGGDVVIE